jgi:MOSC domain-containing protein YiiM
MDSPEHLTEAQLAAGQDHVMRAPKDGGELKLIVRRPAANERETLPTGELDVETGLVGDNWKNRSSDRSEDGRAHPDMQLTIMSERVIELIAQQPDRWQLAGDQLFVDMDLSEENLPAWTRLAIGSAVIQVTDQPHTGCAKFVERFGPAALRWVNMQKGMNLRGINTRVVQSGTISAGDIVKRLPDEHE